MHCQQNMMSYCPVKLKKGSSLNEFLSRYDTRVVSGDLSCIHGSCTSGCTQEGIMVDSGRWGADRSGFRWAKMALDNIGSPMLQTCAIWPKYVQRHQSGVEYRFHLPDLNRKPARMALRPPPMPERFLTLGLS